VEHDTAQVTCFDSKIMAQLSVFTEHSFEFLDQNNMRAPSHIVLSRACTG
jgi:hypothetical protein